MILNFYLHIHEKYLRSLVIMEHLIMVKLKVDNSESEIEHE